VFPIHVIIVIPLTMMLILFHYLVDHTDYKHWLPLIESFTCKVYSKLTLVRLGSPAPEARSCDAFDVRNETSIPLGHNFYDDTHCDELEKASDPSSPLALAPSLKFSTVTG